MLMHAAPVCAKTSGRGHVGSQLSVDSLTRMKLSAPVLGVLIQPGLLDLGSEG